MASMFKEMPNGGFIITNATLSYPHLFTPRAAGKNPPPDAKKRYTCDLVLEPDTDISAFSAALQQVAHAKFGDNFANMNLRWPIRQSGSKQGDDPRFSGRYVISCARQEEQGAPEVVDGAKQPIKDPGAVYPGCKVAASIGLFAYSSSSSGVSCGLEAIMFQADGERLDNRIDAAHAFEGIEGGIPSSMMGPAGGVPVQGQPTQGLPGQAPQGLPGQAPQGLPGQPAPDQQAPQVTTPGINPATGQPYFTG